MGRAALSCLADAAAEIELVRAEQRDHAGRIPAEYTPTTLDAPIPTAVLVADQLEAHLPECFGERDFLSDRGTPGSSGPEQHNNHVCGGNGRARAGRSTVVLTCQTGAGDHVGRARTRRLPDEGGGDPLVGRRRIRQLDPDERGIRPRGFTLLAWRARRRTPADGAACGAPRSRCRDACPHACALRGSVRGWSAGASHGALIRRETSRQRFLGWPAGRRRDPRRWPVGRLNRRSPAYSRGRRAHWWPGRRSRFPMPARCPGSGNRKDQQSLGSRVAWRWGVSSTGVRRSGSAPA